MLTHPKSQKAPQFIPSDSHRDSVAYRVAIEADAVLSRLSPSEEEEAVAMGKHLREAMGGALKGYFQETLSFLETSEKNLKSFQRIHRKRSFRLFKSRLHRSLSLDQSIEGIEEANPHTELFLDDLISRGLARTFDTESESSVRAWFMSRHSFTFAFYISAVSQSLRARVRAFLLPSIVPLADTTRFVQVRSMHALR